MKKTYYDVLGIRQSATSDEIKAAYHKKAKLWHPDNGGSTRAMVLVNKAYKVLTTERVAYDGRVAAARGQRTQQRTYKTTYTYTTYDDYMRRAQAQQAAQDNEWLNEYLRQQREYVRQQQRWTDEMRRSHYYSTYNQEPKPKPKKPAVKLTVKHTMWLFFVTVCAMSFVHTWPLWLEIVGFIPVWIAMNLICDLWVKIMKGVWNFRPRL